jgi:glycosyltransferase involved in cell wall biosynthesis
VHALFLNDTSRNGGPGRTLFSILRHVNRQARPLTQKTFAVDAYDAPRAQAIERTVILPREGVVADLLRSEPCFETLVFESGILENPFEPRQRPMQREDFAAPSWKKALRLLGNGQKGIHGVLRMANLVRRKKVEAIFCNGTSACFLGAILGILTGVPVAWHVFYSSVADPIRPIHHWLAARKEVVNIACVSECTATQFVERSKVTLLPDAIDVAEFDPARVASVDLRQELGLPNDAILYLSHGRVIPRKGFVELIRAFAEFKKTNFETANAPLAEPPKTTAKPSAKEPRSAPGSKRKGDSAAKKATPSPTASLANAHLVIVGDTPEDTPKNHLEECKALAHELGIASCTHFLGYRNDVPSLLLAANVVVVPSVYEDPLPRAVMEAMALGRPVVAHRVGGIPDMVVPGETGALVDKGESLVPALLTYADPVLAENHGRAGRARIREHFCAQVHGLRMRKLLFATAARHNLAGAHAQHSIR